MKDRQIRPYALKAGDGSTYTYGIDMTVKVGERSAGRRLAVVVYATRAGEEPPDHTHDTEDEVFYLLRGDVTFRCGGESFEVTEGGLVLLPRGLEHGYQIRSRGEVRLLVVTAPAPDDGSAGWGGFVADLEKLCDPVASPGR